MKKKWIPKTYRGFTIERHGDKLLVPELKADAEAGYFVSGSYEFDTYDKLRQTVDTLYASLYMTRRRERQ